MTEGPEANGAPDRSTEEQRDPGKDPFGLEGLERRAELDWVREKLPYVRGVAEGSRPLYWLLGIVVVVGLAAQVGGYLLKTSVTTEPLALIGDLLYAFGWSLWTGVVVVVFVQILPEAKRRQFKRALDAYEAAQRDEARAKSGQAEDEVQ